MMRHHPTEIEATPLVFIFGVIAIIFISGTLSIDQNIANKSQGYFVQRNIEQANEARRLGYIKYEVNDYAEAFGIHWTSKPGVRRITRSGPDDFDDIGYISFLQLIAIAGKEITITFVEKLHNYAFIFSVAIVSFIVFKACKNIFSGWIFMVLALLLKSNILSLVYGSPDSRTFVIVFPFLVISMVYGLDWLSAYLDRFWGWPGALVLSFGLLIGLMTSIRNSEGFMAFCAVLLFIILLKVGRKQKAVAIATIFIGYFLVTLVMPIVFALHRDIKTGEFNGDMAPYLQTTGSHPSWHSIFLGAGKYSNSLDIGYGDLDAYKIVRSRYPEAMDPVLNIQAKGYFKAVRAIYLDYVVSHPLEYLKNLTKASAELVLYFIPYTTSAGNLKWSYGYLPIKPGVNPGVEDLRVDGTGLINLRYRYLKLSPLEWATYVLAILAIIFAMRLSILGVFGKESKAIFLSTGFYMFMLATTRVLVPQHGLALVTCFWIFSIISFLYVAFIENEIRSFVYLSSQSLLLSIAQVSVRQLKELGELIRRQDVSVSYTFGAIALLCAVVVWNVVHINKLEKRIKILGRTIRSIETIRQSPPPPPFTQYEFKNVNAFRNGSFESWIETPEGQVIPEGFTYYQDGEGGSVEKNTLDVGLKEGAASVLLKPSSKGSSYIRCEVPGFEGLRGRVVRLGVLVKSQNKTEGAIQIDVQDGVNPAVVASYDGMGDWQWLEIDTIIHEEAKYLLLTCNIRCDATDGAYFDGMKFEVLGVRSAETESQSLTKHFEPPAPTEDITNIRNRLTELTRFVAETKRQNSAMQSEDIDKMRNKISELESARLVSETRLQNLTRQVELQLLREDAQSTLEEFIYHQDGFGGSAERNTRDVGLKEGEVSALLKPSSIGNSYLRLEVPRFRELRGHLVRFGVWVKSQNRTPDAIQIDVQDSVNPVIVKSYEGGGEWQWLEIDTIIHEEAKYLLLTCNIRYDATDAVYFDGLKFWAFESR